MNSGKPLFLLVAILLISHAAPASSSYGAIAFPTAQARWSEPLHFSMHLGVNFYSRTSFIGFNNHGTSIYIEPGWRGARAGVGYKVTGMFFLPVYSAYSGFSYMYIWTGDRGNYLGVDTSISFSLINFTWGAWNNIETPLDEDWKIGLGFGIGLP